MERLRARVPGPLLERIERSKEAEIASTAAALAAFLDRDPVFRHALDRLLQPTTCGKDYESAAKYKADGNRAFQQRNYKQAIQDYTKALKLMPWNSASCNDLATIFSNRATSFHKSGLKMEGIRDCGRAIALNESYAKAWYRRGLIKADLCDYQGAVLDMEAAHTRECSVSGKKQVEVELLQVRQKLKLASPQAQRDLSTSLKAGISAQTAMYWSADKQWGLRTTSEVQAGTLVHSEEALAGILLKKHRPTHCHGCFGVVPADSVPCIGCGVVSYCNDACRDDATVEHKLECGGSGWAAALPEEGVLAARILVTNLQCEVDLCHHYNDLPSQTKVELYLLAATLAKCLKASWLAFSFEDLLAKLVLLLAMLRFNAMGIIHIYSSDETGSSSGAHICGIEHVVVAQALFVRGSKFNHSCSPNVHVSYVKRTLRAHCTEALPAFCPLEISYGVQVGESEKSQRKIWLRDHYLFECSCEPCRLGLVSDLLHIAYYCCQPGCQGIVLDPDASDEDILLPGGSGTVRFLIEHCNILPQDINKDSPQFILPAKRCLTCKAVRSLKDDGRKNWRIFKFAAANGRKCFHPFNKQLAQMEDIVARLYCEAGQQPAAAIVHARRSIEILERIYGKDHIAMAYERLKLASIAGITGAARECLAMAERTFSFYYGFDYGAVFPDLKRLTSLE
ncbi:histone-lysine N-methyltransferase ASHR1 [Selaginella moellendorffii]|uniref:histone-lysine N-methyltransferase ASHR1 n=1 Tax=Selaginella moellendorffii TaxID=88036 RepID=UPI000D1CD025|nr:histone-lysine N-methyltransferase ASHR1 [Selaginella moellendorffii]|eukprot:XP_024539432.1 histone-lysine N-methyltransferase ASHR1 [Selaginella moellendorffii]